MSDSTDAGAKFEREVANLYRMLGYDVKTNINFRGFQIDIIATRRVPGADETKLMIECKYKGKGSVSNEELSKLSNTFTEAGREHGFHKAVMVTNSAFSQSSQAFAAEKSHIVLKTIKELEEETLDIFSSYGRYKRDYQKTAINTLYIPSHGHGRLPGDSQHSITFANVETSLINWIDEGPPGFLTVMADFGIGKTTLLERLKYHYCDLYERGASRKKPLFFRLRDVHRYKDIDDYLAATVSTEFRSATDASLIWPLIEAGDFLLLLDGFDEVALQVDRKQRHAYFVRLSALFNTPSHSIMTCRPTFFINHTEYDDLIDEVIDDLKTRTHPRGDSAMDLHAHRPEIRSLTEELRSGFRKKKNIKRIRGLNTARLDLLPFTEAQIDAYLAQRNNDFARDISSNWQEVRRFLNEVTHIRVLMWRPILLDMITRTVLSGRINIKNLSQRFGAAEIYEAYLQSLLEQEYDERETRRLIPPAVRQTLLEVVAIALYQRDTMDISFDGLVRALTLDRSRLIRMHPELETHNIEDVGADIVLTGFLSRDVDDKLKFSHKSFMEFLVARFLVKGIMNGTSDPVGDTPLPSDIIFFLGAFLMFHQELVNRAARQLRTGENDRLQWRKNLARSLVATSVPQEGLTIEQLQIDDIDAHEIDWHSVDLNSVTFDVRKLEKVQFESSTLTNTTFANPIAEIRIAGNSEFSLTFEHRITNLEVADSFGTVELSKAGEIRRARFDRANCRFIGSIAIEHLIFENGTIKATKLRTGHLSLNNCVESTIREISFRSCEIVKSAVQFEEAPRALPELEDKLLDSESGALFRAKDCLIGMPAFSSNAPLRRLMFAKGMEFVNCKFAGLQVEDGAPLAKARTTCEGVIFLVGDERQTPRSDFMKHEGRLLLIDRATFLRNEQLAHDAILVIEERFGDWMSDWIKLAKQELDDRTKKTPSNSR